MSLSIHRYGQITDAEERLRGLAGDPAASPPLWLVPSGADREELAAILAPGGTFGSRPEILTWGSLLRRLSDAAEAEGIPVRRRRAIDPPDHHLILGYLLRRLRESERNRPEEERLHFPSATLREGFLPLLSEGLKELIREDASPEDLAAAAGDEPDGVSPLFCRLYREYRDYLEERGLIDAASVPSEIRRLLTDPETKTAAAAALAEHRLLAVGFLSFFGGELGAFRALTGVTEVHLFQPAASLREFRDASAQLEGIPALSEDLPGSTTDFLEFLAPDSARETEGVARLLALWSAGAGDLLRLGPFPGWSRIGIQSPGSSEAIVSALRKFRVPFRSSGVRASGTLVHDAVVRSVGTAPSWPADRTAALLARAAMGAALYDARSIARASDGFPGARALARSGGTEATAALERARELSEGLRRGGGTGTLLRILRRFVASALDDLSEEKGLRSDDRIRESASYLEELDRKILSLEELTPDLGPAGRGRLSGAEALSYLSTWAEETTTARPPASESVSLHEGSPPTLAHFDLLILTGVTGRNWPGTFVESPLLRESLRERVNEGIRTPGRTHLPTISERRTQREALFRRLVSSARSVAFFSVAKDDSGRPMPPSPLPAELTRDRAFRSRTPGNCPLRVPRDIPDPEEPHFPEIQVTSATGKVDRGTFPRTIVPPSDSIPRTVRLSELDRLLDCPYAWACTRILGLPEPGGTLFDPTLAGNFLHRVWQRVYGEITREGELPDPVAPPIRSSLLRIFDEGAPDPTFGYAELGREARLSRQRRRLRERASALAAFLEIGEARRRPGFPRTEIRLETDLPSLSLPSPRPEAPEPFIFTGRADRLDRVEDGRGGASILIWDYKLGSVKDRDRGSLQLPAYALLLRESGEEIAGWAYLGHGDTEADGRFADPALARAIRNMKRSPRKDSCSPEALAARMEEARAGMIRAAEILASGRFEANYQAGGCAKCPWRGLCRRGEERGEGLALPGGDGETLVPEEGWE
jgi:RecB family exonuclease